MDAQHQKLAAKSDSHHKTLDNWSLSYLVDYMEENGQERKYLQRGVEEYKRYLNICISNPDKSFPVSRAVDDFWHNHILFTHDYVTMCETLGVSYLHHKPTINDEERAANKADYAMFLRIYAETYGEQPNSTYWPAALDGRCTCNACVNGPVSEHSLKN